MYSMPKIHKEAVPLRPIVSTIGSPTHRLAKELARILSPLCGQTESFVKNSTDFARKMNEVNLDERDMTVSFDVASMFTKVPVADALQVISTCQREDSTPGDKSNIPPDEICQLVEMCLHLTYFQFGDQFFEQLKGAVMGSPFSPIVANLYMEPFEKRLGILQSQTQSLAQVRG